MERFTEEEYRQVVDQYIDALYGAYDLTGDMDGEGLEEAMKLIEEEVCADAYAGINAFGAGADRFGEAVNERMDQLWMGKKRAQDNGSEKPTGPPERYSADDMINSYNGRSLVYDPGIYTYDFLTSQKDMRSIKLPEVPSVRTEDGKIEPDAIVNKGIKNALSVGTERAGRVFVMNRYTGQEVVVTGAAIRHGLNGAYNRKLTNARLGAVIGEIVQNAIPINALYDTANNVKGTYAMAGHAFDSRGREFVAIVTVEQRTNSVTDISTFDMTHSISGRQKRGKPTGSPHSMLASDGGSQADTKSQGFSLIKASSMISIQDFLLGVKEAYQSILSEDVLRHLEDSRDPGGYYSGRVRYSYAGEEALTADMEALERAKEMQAAGVAEETIRQETGWFVGMDGKWRWEIDDSSMRYDASGDLRGAESARWAREDFESARDDLWGHADMGTLDTVRAYNRADLAGDQARKQELYDELISGPFAYYFGQYAEALDAARKVQGPIKGGMLQDYIDHPALFEAYPQLRSVGQLVIDVREAKKSQSDSDEGSSSDAVMGQLMG